MQGNASTPGPAVAADVEEEPSVRCIDHGLPDALRSAGYDVTWPAVGDSIAHRTPDPLSWRFTDLRPQDRLGGS
jgi:hypothetical protein